MTDQKRSKLTDEHRDEARKLRGLWDSRPHRTQAQFGEAFGLGNQSNVGHYLNARSPLNLDAAMAFAQELGVDISAFSSRLAQRQNEIAHGVGRSLEPPEKGGHAVGEALANYTVVTLESALARVASYLADIGEYNPKTVTSLFETLANDPSLHPVVATGLKAIKRNSLKPTKQNPPATQGVKVRTA